MNGLCKAGRKVLQHNWRMSACRAGFGSEAAAAPAGEPGVATGLNMMKGEADPQLLPDAEYPPWLWGLAEQQPMLSQLRRAGDEELDLELQQRRIKLENREAIRDRNFSKAKKQ